MPFLVLQPKFFFAVVEGAGARTRLSKICSLALPCDNSRNTRHRTPFSLSMPAEAPLILIVRAGLAIAAATAFLDRAAEEQRSKFYTAVATEFRTRYQV